MCSSGYSAFSIADGKAAVDGGSMGVPQRVPPRQAMHAGDREPQRIEETIDRRDLAPGDDRDGAAQQRVEMHQRLPGREVELHLVGTIGDRDQRSVEIQKQGNALGIAQVGQGHNRRFVMNVLMQLRRLRPTSQCGKSLI